jgi:hypothetical protein
MAYYKVDDSGTQIWYILFALIALVIYGAAAIVLAILVKTDGTKNF